MAPEEPSEEILKYLHSVTNKRAKFVIDHILEHGSVTTEEIKNGGYDHPPRAARDVRELGIPLETTRLENEGKTRRIAVYKFGDLSQINKVKHGGRSTFPKEFKEKLFSECNGKCAICLTALEERILQTDHKIPYEVGGSHANLDLVDFQLLCGSCNRAKSWSCEHCINWTSEKDPLVCLRCYWGNPTSYNHIAMRDIRRSDIVWTGDETRTYERLKLNAETKKSSIPDFVKDIIKKVTEDQVPKK